MATQYTSYWLYQKYEKRGSQEAIPVYPNVYSVDADGTMSKVIKIENDAACGYVPTGTTQYRWVNLDPSVDYYCDECPPAPQYRWVESGTTCVGYDKYQRAIKQVSYDSGVTWSNVEPAEYSATTLIEADSPDCGYVEPMRRWERTIDTICVEAIAPLASDYLTIEALEDCDIRFDVSEYSIGTMYYSNDDGNTWEKLSINATDAGLNRTISVAAGSKTRFKGDFKITYYDATYRGIGSFVVSRRFNVEGNPMSLIYLDNFIGRTELRLKEAFLQLFAGSNVVNADKLLLPATTLTRDCYWGMFAGCTSLTTAPQLPATTMAWGCYMKMFNGCTSLTQAPELPATTLATQCYAYMFYGCSGLTKAPDLPATTLVGVCYDYMFWGCSSLNYIKCLAQSNNTGSNTFSWVAGVSSTGIFVKARGSSWTNPGVHETSAIPPGWEVQEV